MVTCRPVWPCCVGTEMVVPSCVTMVTAVPRTCRCELRMSSVSMVTSPSRSFCSDASKTSASTHTKVFFANFYAKVSQKSEVR